MKKQYEEMSSEGLSRRRILKMAGVGIAAGVVGTAGVTGVVQESILANDVPKEIDILIHFADVDYRESVMKNADVFKGLNAELLMRSYIYIDYANKASRSFRKIHPHTEMSKVLGKSRVVASTCSLTLMEAQKKGAVPIYLNDGKASDLTIAALEAQHIDVVDLTDRKIIVKSLRHSLWQSRAKRRV